MGWFSSSSSQSVPADEVRPISQARLIELFTREGWFYNVDDDGDLGGRWDFTFIYFFLQGSQKEILNISGRFLIPIPSEKIDEARVFIEDWHRDRLWPKAYVLTDSDGEYRVFADVPFDHEAGASDAQLAQHVKCGIGTLTQCFGQLKDALGLEWSEQE